MTKTKAEQISTLLNDDGMCWASADGVDWMDLIDQHDGTPAYRDDSDTIRYDFSDGSALLDMTGGWDIGYQGCFCAQGVGHTQNCPALGRREVDSVALLESIEALAEHDYSAPPGDIGYRERIYLDPETQTVDVHAGDGEPMRAFHGIDLLVCSVPGDAIPGSVSYKIWQIRDKLELILSLWRGTDWDGSNNIGVWAWDACCDKPGCKCVSYEQPVFAYYNNPSDFFDVARPELEALARKGYSAADIMADLDMGNEDDGAVREDDARKYIDGLVECVQDEG